MSETTYSLKLATGKAKCKVCKEKIEKGALRIFTESPQSESMDYAMTSSTHPSCFKLPRKLSTGENKITIEEFVDDFLQDGGETESLLPDKRDEVIAAMTEAAEKTKKKKKKDDGKETIMTRLKAAVQAGENDEEEPPKKKVKKDSSAGEEGELEAMLPLYRKYHKLKVDELKDFMRWNNQKIGGNKEFTLFKVMDGELHGRLAVCPICQGQLAFQEGDYEKVHCQGRKDPDTYQIERCDYTAPPYGTGAAPRFQPFYLEKPSEEQEEAMKKLVEDAQGKGDDSDNAIAQDLLIAAEKLDLDLDTKEGKKKAAADFVALVEGKLDLPENRDPKLEVGKLVLANAGKSKKDIMQALFDKFGFAESKKQKAAAKEAATEASIANPKNAGLIMAFKECSSYYFKEGNSNAGLTYNKAITTLKDMEEEVTAENAMSFSKGKTKKPGIGKGTAEKMKEFCEKGTFEKLEEKRAAHA